MPRETIAVDELVVPYLFTEKKVNPVPDDHVAMIIFDALDPDITKEVSKELLIT